jgi:hypothetical protein
MQITRDTKVYDLVETYPFLLDHLASLRPEFEKLRKPVLYNTIARVATLSTVAEMGDIGVDELIESLQRRVALESIHAEEPGVETPPPMQRRAPAGRRPSRRSSAASRRRYGR